MTRSIGASLQQVGTPVAAFWFNGKPSPVGPAGCSGAAERK
jgi:hypothetical protein